MERIEHEGVTYIYDPDGEKYDFEIQFKFDYSTSEMENQNDCGGTICSVGDDMTATFILPNSIVNVAKENSNGDIKLNGGLEKIIVNSLEDEELKNIFNKNGIDEATIFAIKNKFQKCLEKCSALRGTKITMEQFKTYIETGRLFATEEERIEFENSVKAKRETKARKEEKRDAIQDEIMVAKQKVGEHIRKIEQSNIKRMREFKKDNEIEL